MRYHARKNVCCADFQRFLTDLAARTLKGGKPSREGILTLLALPPDSHELELLGKTSRRMASELTGNNGRVWSAIGLDSRPCRMNCAFCSFGEKWGITDTEYELSQEQILNIARGFIADGARWLTLRTTEFYSQKRLMETVRLVREKISGNYEIVVNTGELTTDNAEALRQAGVSVIYHSLRLGEGCCTTFSPDERKATLAAVRDSGLKLAHLVEPVGPEHTDEDIATVFLYSLEYGAADATPGAHGFNSTGHKGRTLPLTFYLV